ncbi:Myb-like_DNA-binding domain-containing protein [Hexamita inflata]|uniref:Myb-like_DNA-binding domain-containing protein n=1 Tax=Hexamita inflata TaxID=28002 RepID=A0ABP1J0A2_9EUKA
MSFNSWSDEVTQLLIAVVKRYNFNWEELQYKMFPNRSISELQNKFHSNGQFKALANQPMTEQEKQLIQGHRQNGYEKINEIQQELADVLFLMSQNNKIKQ